MWSNGRQDNNVKLFYNTFIGYIITPHHHVLNKNHKNMETESGLKTFALAKMHVQVCVKLG